MYLSVPASYTLKQSKVHVGETPSKDPNEICNIGAAVTVEGKASNRSSDKMLLKLTVI